MSHFLRIVMTFENQKQNLQKKYSKNVLKASLSILLYIKRATFGNFNDHPEGVEIALWCMNQLLLEIKNKGGSPLCEISVR